MASTMKDTINGQEYTFQKVPPREWLKIQYRTTDKNGKRIPHDFYDEIFKHVVVSPQVDMDDFDEYEEVEAVMDVAINFQQFANGKSPSLL